MYAQNQTFGKSIREEQRCVRQLARIENVSVTGHLDFDYYLIDSPKYSAL